MTFGSATLTGLAASLLATLVWFLCHLPVSPPTRPRGWIVLATFLFGWILVTVALAGPIVKLP